MTPKNWSRQSPTLYLQCAKKVVCDSLGLVDFTKGLVNPVLNLKGK